MKSLGPTSGLTPEINPTGMANQGTATAKLSIPTARQEPCYSCQTGSRIMALSGGRFRQPSARSTGEVGFLKAYFYFRFPPIVPAYRYFCTRDCLNGEPLLTLRTSGWIASAVQVVVTPHEP